MTIERVLWGNWLRSRSWIRRYPAVAALLPFLLGCVLWRIRQIRWEWWERETRVLPLCVLGIVGVLWVTRRFWWKSFLALRHHPRNLVWICLLGAVGYGYTQFSWDQTRFPVPPISNGESSEVWLSAGDMARSSEIQSTLLIDGRILEMKGNGITETWAVAPIRARMVQNPMNPFRVTGKVQVVRPKIMQGVSRLRIGDRVILEGELQPFAPATNPGQFDYQRYQRYLRFAGQMREPEVVPQSRRPFDLMRWLDDGRSYAARFFTAHLSETNQPLVMSFLTGETDYLNDVELEQIRLLGLSHILAISGLNLGLIVLSLKKLMILCHLPQRFHPVGLLAGIWLSVLFVGCQPSALRVGVYLTLAQFGEILHRPLQPLNLLGVTAWIILLVNPLSLFLLSFQLSFVVYLAILVLYQPMLHWIKQFMPRLPNWMQKVQQSLALSLAAFIGSMPIILFSFFELPIQGILMNLWAVPLSEIIIVLIFATLFIGSILPPIGLVLTWALDRLVGLFNGLVHIFANLCPWIWQPGRPLWIWIGLLYLSVGLVIHFAHGREMPGLWRKREKSALERTLLLVGVFFIVTLLIPAPSGLEWILLDVGQGDGMFFRFPQGQVMMVDGGGQPIGDNYVGEKIIKPFLLSRGIRAIDLLCITHFDADHVRGLLPILQQMRVKAIWAPEGSGSEYALAVERIARQRHIPIYHPVAGDFLQFGGVQIDVFNPEKGRYYPQENDRSITLRLNWAGLSMMLTGDLGFTRENELLRERYEVQTEILKVGHHGSKYSTSREFLDKITPKMALISVGPNRYGHPAEETLERLQKQGCTILRTDEVGAIQVYAQGKQVQVRTFNNFRQIP